MTYESQSKTPDECLYFWATNRIYRAAAEHCEAETTRQLGAMIKRLMHALAGQYELPAQWLHDVDRIVKLYDSVSVQEMRECLIFCADLVQPAEAARYFELTGERVEDVQP